MPVGTYGRVAPRSGLGLSESSAGCVRQYLLIYNDAASKFMIDTGAGVVDEDYRGEVFVLLFNLSEKDYEVAEGDRIAQLILERIVTPEAIEVESLSETVRGGAGFGSTGKQ